MDNTKKIKLQVSEAGVIALLHECCDELKVTNGCDRACIFMLLGWSAQVYFKREQHSVAATEPSGDVSLVIMGY